MLLVGHRSSASVPELLEQARICIDVDGVRLEVQNAERVPDSDAVQTRLRQLARVSGVEGAEVLQVTRIATRALGRPGGQRRSRRPAR